MLGIITWHKTGKMSRGWVSRDLDGELQVMDAARPVERVFKEQLIESERESSDAQCTDASGVP